MPQSLAELQQHWQHANPPQGWATPLPDLGVIRAEGAEALAFLQSQLTQDVQPLAPGQWCLAGYASPKGRLLAVFWLGCLAPQHYVLVLPTPLLPALLKRLKMFVLRSKVLLSDASAELAVTGLMGVADAAPLSSVLPLALQLGTPPCADDAAAHAHWAKGLLLAGLPQVLEATTDHFLAQEIDLDLAGGVSFKKGCYPGQEIVARVHYLGRVKQRLFLAQGVGAAGDVLRNAEGQAVGSVMAAAAEGLAVSVQLAQAGQALHGADGGAVQLIARLHEDAVVA